MNALVVGGSNGIGLALVLNLLQCDDVERIYVMDKQPFPKDYIQSQITDVNCDLSREDCCRCLEDIQPIQILLITAGFGHLKLFSELSERYIRNIFAVNAVAPLSIIKHYYAQLIGDAPFYCGVMVSIAGHLNSPFYSMYSATKAALSKGIEAINVELEESGSKNRILEVSPGRIDGTSFNGGITLPEKLADFAATFLEKTLYRELVYIPQYDEVYKNVLTRYHTNPHQFGKESYQYKIKDVKNRV